MPGLKSMASLRGNVDRAGVWRGRRCLLSAARARNYLTEDSSRYRRPIVTHVYREAIELYDRHLYEKRVLCLHMIRAEWETSCLAGDPHLCSR